MKKLVQVQQLPVELTLAGVAYANVDHVPVDFTLNSGNVNILIDKHAHKMWLCINGQAAVRIRGFSEVTYTPGSPRPRKVEQA